MTASRQFETLATAELLKSKPFLISQAPEWQALRSPEMAVSASVDIDVQYPEELRTGASLYVQEYLHTADEAHWRKLTEAQTRKDSEPLQWNEYQALAALSHATMPDASTYEAAQYINLVHDIGKDSELMRAVELDPSRDSHDEGLRRLFLPHYKDALKRFLPTYADPRTFNDDQRRIIEGVLTADFNFARFMQSQTSQQEINNIADIPPDIMGVIIMHGIHDIGGAMGHKNLTSSMTLDSPTAHRMLDAAHALLGSAEDFGLAPDTEITPTTRFSAYLSLRELRLRAFLPEDATFIEVSEHIAQLDIANLLRCNTPEEFATVQAAYHKLPDTLRLPWTINQAALLTSSSDTPSSLEKYGTEYLPAFLRTTLKKGDVETTYLALGYFSQILMQTMSSGYIEAAHHGGELPEAPTFDQINFYHLAKWFSEADTPLDSDVHIAYEQTGRTVTPMVVDSLYTRFKHTHPLVHPDRFKVEGL